MSEHIHEWVTGDILLAIDEMNSCMRVTESQPTYKPIEDIFTIPDWCPLPDAEEPNDAS